MNAAPGLEEHRHLGIVDREAAGLELGDQLGRLGRGDHAILAESHDVAAQGHGFFEGNRHNLDALAGEPVDDVGLGGVEADGRALLGQHADHQVDVDIEAVDGGVFDLPALVLEPAADLARRHLLAAKAGEADQHGARLYHIEVAAFEVAGADHVVNRDLRLEVETKTLGVLATPPRIGELADHRPIGRHEGRIPGVDLIRGQFVLAQLMDRDAGLLIGIDQLAVLAHRHLLVEAVALALGIADDRAVGRVVLHPMESLGRAQQHIAQHAVFAVGTPAFQLGGAAAETARPEGRAAIRQF